MRILTGVAGGLAAIALSGCASLVELQLEERPLYGRVVYFSPEDGLAVVRVMPGLVLPEEEVLARDSESLTCTARLLATRARSGVYVTFRVREGRPFPGDEVVADDPPPGEG